MEKMKEIKKIPLDKVAPGDVPAARANTLKVLNAIEKATPTAKAKLKVRLTTENLKAKDRRTNPTHNPQT